MTTKVATSLGLSFWHLFTDLQELFVFAVVHLLGLELDLGVGGDVAPRDPSKLEQRDLKRIALLRRHFADSLFSSF